MVNNHPVAQRLYGLLHQVGYADGLSPDCAENLAHLPLFQHFADTLNIQEHYLSPEDEELAEEALRYEENPECHDEELERLQHIYRTDPDALEAELDGDHDLFDAIAQLCRDEDKMARNDKQLHRVRSQLGLASGSAHATRSDSQQWQHLVDRQQRAVQQELSAVTQQNTAHNAALQAVQESSRHMQELLHNHGPECVLLAQPLDELRKAEEAISAELDRARSLASAGHLSAVLEAQRVKGGALPDMPWEPSATRLVSGMCAEAHAEVTAEQQRLSEGAMEARDERDRLRAEMAALAKEVEVLEAVARDPRGGAAMELLLQPGGGGAGGGAAGEALLRAEVKALREHVDSLHGGALRSSLLVALAAASGDELRRSVLLLRRQHLQYTGDMMGAVLGMLMQQRARVELIEDLRSQERCQLHDVYLRLQDTAQRLDAHYRAAAADAADHTRMAGEAEAAALLACDRGPQALLGPSDGGGALGVAYTLLEQHKQLLEGTAERVAMAGMPGKAGAGGGEGGRGATAEAGSGGGGGGAGHAFLEGVLADPANRTLGQLGSVAAAVAGLRGRLERVAAARVCEHLGALTAEGRERLREMRELLGGQGLGVEGGGAATASAAAAAGNQVAEAGGGAGTGGAAGGSWPQLRDPGLQAALDAHAGHVASTCEAVQAFVTQNRLLQEGGAAASEQMRLERSVLGAFWMAPEQLDKDVQGLRERLAALLASVGPVG